MTCMAIKNNKNNLISIFTQSLNHHIAMIQNTKNAMTQKVIGLYQFGWGDDIK